MKEESRNPKLLTVSREICDWMLENGTNHIFLVPGAQIEPLCLELANQDNLTMIVACHELGAGFMADGYARASLNFGVCAGIGGPGASYMLPSAIISRVDESAVLYITGDVSDLLKDHLCFQDTGINGSRDKQLYLTAIDFTEAILKPEETRLILEKIKTRLKSKLPAHLVIPSNIQASTVRDNQMGEICSSDGDRFDSQEDVANTLSNLIQNSKYPVILAGNRIYGGSNVMMLNRFVETTGIQIATTFNAKGIVSEDNPFSLGNFGYAGTRMSEDVILNSNCDLLIMIGINLNERNTYSFSREFLPPDRNGILINSKSTIAFTAENSVQNYNVQNISRVLELAIEKLHHPKKDQPISIHPINKTAELLESADITYKGYVLFDWVLGQIVKAMPENTMYFVDSGLHRVFAGVKCRIKNPLTFFTSDSQAPMGWAICASIGAKLARPQATTLVITGDGCMRMHALEIATAVRYALPVIFVVSNNSSYSSIEYRIDSLEAKNKFASLPLINWAEFANSIGAKGIIVAKAMELEDAITQAISSKLPCVIDVRTHPNEPKPISASA